MRALEMVHDTDPAQVIRDRLASINGLDDVEVSYNNVLVAQYIRDGKTKGGLYLPDQTKREDEFQGKAYLVIKCGAMAFQDDEHVKFGGFRAEIGDWVAARPADGWAITAGDTPFRIFRDVDIKMKIPRPDMTW